MLLCSGRLLRRAPAGSQRWHKSQRYSSDVLVVVSELRCTLRTASESRP